MASERVLNTFVAGASLVVDKDSARADAGDVAVVVSVSEQAARNSALIYIMEPGDQCESVKAYAQALAEFHDGDGEEPDASFLPDVSAIRLHDCSKGSMVSLSSNWREVFTHMEEPAPTHAADGADLVGTDIVVSKLAVVENNRVAGMFSGSIHVEAARGAYVTISMRFQGRDVTFEVPESIIREYADVEDAAVDDGDEDVHTVEVHSSQRTFLAVQLISALPQSKEADRHRLATNEVLGVAHHAGLSHEFTTESHDIECVCKFLLSQLQSILSASGAAERTWPTQSYTRLGHAIKAFSKSPPVPPSEPPPPQFPLVEAFKALLASASDFDAFVDDTIPLTCTLAKQATAKKHRHIALGALEGALKPHFTVVSIGTLGLNMSVGEVLAPIFAALPDPGSAHAASADVSGTRQFVNVSVKQHDLSGDDEERRTRNILRTDASTVLADSAARARVVTFQGLTASNPAQLFAGVNKETNESLVRLLTSGHDVERALAGTRHPPPASRPLRALACLPAHPLLTRAPSHRYSPSCMCACARHIPTHVHVHVPLS